MRDQLTRATLKSHKKERENKIEARGTTPHADEFWSEENRDQVGIKSIEHQRQILGKEANNTEGDIICV